MIIWGGYDRLQRFQHRRKILRATWFHAHTDADGNTYGNCNSYCESQSHADGNTDAVRAISYTITYAYDNRYSNAGAASDSRSPASPNTTTASVAWCIKPVELSRQL